MAADAVAHEHQAAWNELRIDIPWHARLYAFVVIPPWAFVLIDTNSDLREIELALYRRTPHGDWVWARDQDDVGTVDGDVALTNPGWAVGRGEPGSAVQVRYGDETHEVPVDSQGWWAFADEEGLGIGAVPRRIR